MLHEMSNVLYGAGGLDLALQDCTLYTLHRCAGTQSVAYRSAVQPAGRWLGILSQPVDLISFAVLVSITSSARSASPK